MKSVWRFLFDVLELFLSFKMTPRIKIDQGIQILLLKKDAKFLLFSLLFFECWQLYLTKPTAAKSLFLMCCITFCLMPEEIKR